MTEPAGRPVRGVLFDVDGTLVDSNFFHTVCWWQAFRQQGIDVPSAIIHRAIGMGADKLIEHVLSECDLRADLDDSQVTAAHDALYAAYWPALRPLRGARELLRRCHDVGATTVLASSASEQELAVLIRVLASDTAIDVTTSSADAEASKPAPDIIGVALDKAKLTAQDALFIGDSVWDVHAAGQLGVRCIGLESGGTSTAELLEAGALATYQNPRDLLDHDHDWLPS